MDKQLAAKLIKPSKPNFKFIGLSYLVILALTIAGSFNFSGCENVWRIPLLIISSMAFMYSIMKKKKFLIVGSIIPLIINIYLFATDKDEKHKDDK